VRAITLEQSTFDTHTHTHTHTHVTYALFKQCLRRNALKEDRLCTDFMFKGREFHVCAPEKERLVL